MTNAAQANPAALTIGYIILFVFYIISVVGMWKIYTKAGEAGWKSLIPVYNLYILYKIAWKPMMFPIAIGVSVIGGFLSSMYTQQGNIVLGLIGAACSIAFAVIEIMMNVRLAKSFGKSTLFGIGLLLFPYIFTCILGYGSAEYEGPQE